MGKWMPHDTQFRTEDDVFIAFKHSLDDEAVIAAHNADIDALTAERDELQRRLDAVVAIVGLEQQGEFEDWPAGEHLRALRDIRAIAEGRDNG